MPGPTSAGRFFFGEWGSPNRSIGKTCQEGGEFPLEFPEGDFVFPCVLKLHEPLQTVECPGGDPVLQPASLGLGEFTGKAEDVFQEIRKNTVVGTQPLNRCKPLFRKGDGVVGLVTNKFQTSEAPKGVRCGRHLAPHLRSEIGNPHRSELGLEFVDGFKIGFEGPRQVGLGVPAPGNKWCILFFHHNLRIPLLETCSMPS